jgi:hypothetical protein
MIRRRNWSMPTSRRRSGRVAGEVSTLALVPRVADAIAPRPVVAAGGIADARGVVAVLALGAQAAVLATRFLASAESRAHPHYKQRLLEADEGSTVRTILFGHGWPNAPHRTLRTAFVEQWLGQEARGQQSRPDEPAVGQTLIGGQTMPVLRFMGFPPNAEASGDIDAMDLLAGQSVGLVRAIKPAGQIVHELVEEARQIIAQHLLGLVQPAYQGRGMKDEEIRVSFIPHPSFFQSGAVSCRRNWRVRSRSSGCPQESPKSRKSPEETQSDPPYHCS